ncbi:MAG: hypothetical protein KDD25_04270 [Bdellovibrionales bacterium]|nr:hypothetical protein [Bdellovibrionales bacterium]
MKKGYNSDIFVQGIAYHVQTEDFGDVYSYIVTKVFKSGTVVKSYKKTYGEIFHQSPNSDSQMLVNAMRSQHREILDQLNSGKLIP